MSNALIRVPRPRRESVTVATRSYRIFLQLLQCWSKGPPLGLERIGCKFSSYLHV